MRGLPALSSLPSRPVVGPLAESLKLLTDEHRLAIIAMLARGEWCVCHLVEILGLRQSTVSHHIGVLRRAGLVRDRHDRLDEGWTYYALVPAAVARLHAQLGDFLALPDLPAEAAERPAPPCPPLAEG